MPKKKMGRPIVGEPKNINMHIKIDKSTYDKLTRLAKMNGVVIRND